MTLSQYRRHRQIQPLREGEQPSILFRVEVYDKQLNGKPSYWNNYNRDRQNIVPRDQCRVLDQQAFIDHLTWNRQRGTPCISFFRSWEQALRRRDFYIGKGVQSIAIIAVWARNLSPLYDAYDVASKLSAHPKACINLYRGEFLLHGSIYADEYRILAVFEGRQPATRVSFLVEGRKATASVPGSFFTTQALHDEIYSLTGTYNEDKLYLLVWCLSGCQPAF